MKIGQRIVRRLVTGARKVIKEQQAYQAAAGEPFEIPLAVKSAGGMIEIPIKIRPLVSGVEIPQKPTPPLPPKEVREVEGLEIPSEVKKAKLGKIGPREAKREPIIYPLIPRSPKKGERIFAYVKIYWDEKTNMYIYQLDEPPLTSKIKQMMSRVKELLEQKLEIDFSKLGAAEAKEYISKQVDEIMRYFKVQITPEERVILGYYIDRDFIGLGRIEPLMQDPNIEDISCDGVNSPLFIFHRNPDLGSVVTNIVFPSPEELDSFIIRLAQLSGKSVSVAEPLISGTLPDGSRLQATLATDIARKGSNFTIRKFTEEPLTPVHLLKYGTIDSRTLAYLWLLVDYGRSILVSGGTATGKTSMLNVLSLFIRPEKKIVSIEDTAEIRLPHPHWVPGVARTAISKGERGEVDLFDLLRESLRQRPDYIVVGEVRGKEAYVLFQQIATGHPSLATIHAEDMNKLFDRLTTQPIALPPPLVASLDVIVFLVSARYKERFVRRVSEVVEVVEFDLKANQPVVNKVFAWNAFTDKFEVSGKSIILKKISKTFGIPEQEVVDELQRRTLVLEWMKKRNIIDYRSVYQVITLYYTSPTRVLAVAMGES
jgi:flagellar protein FlaI